MARFENSDANVDLLPRRWVQLGDVSCVVYFADEEGQWNLHVLLTVTQGAGIIMYEHVYNNETSGFDTEVVFTTEHLDNVNIISMTR